MSTTRSPLRCRSKRTPFSVKGYSSGIAASLRRGCSGEAPGVGPKADTGCVVALQEAAEPPDGIDIAGQVRLHR